MCKAAAFPKGLKYRKAKAPKAKLPWVVNHHGPNVHKLTAQLLHRPAYRGLVVVLLEKC